LSAPFRGSLSRGPQVVFRLRREATHDSRNKPPGATRAKMRLPGSLPPLQVLLEEACHTPVGLSEEVQVFVRVGSAHGAQTMLGIYIVHQ